MPKNNLQRFYDAQEQSYQKALAEIRKGKKTSHWMWFIFPQIAGLGVTEISAHYAIEDLEEAELYLKDPVLGVRLVEISGEFLNLENKSALEVLGSPDDLKLRSCMTLFALLPDTHPVFDEVLKKFFDGKKDQRTLRILGFS